MKCIKCGKRHAFGQNKKSKGGDGLCNPCREAKKEMVEMEKEKDRTLLAFIAIYATGIGLAIITYLIHIGVI